MQKLLSNILVLILAAITSTSCVNLKHVGEFSESSIEGIEKFEALSYNFERNCTDECLQKGIEKLKIHGQTCVCTADKKADSITTLIYNTTRDYFYGLTDISKNQLTNYKTEELTQTLATGDYGSLSLNETDVKAYSSISTIILRAFTDGFRRKKIKEYVRRANEPLQTLLHFLDLNLSGNLIGKMEVQKNSIKSFYFDLISNTELSIYERTKFTEDYFRRISELTAKQEELETYSKVIKTIAEGHTILYNDISKLTEDEIKGQLAIQSTQLKNLSRSLNSKNR